jgi:hypothetical protein
VRYRRATGIERLRLTGWSPPAPPSRWRSSWPWPCRPSWGWAGDSSRLLSLVAEVTQNISLLSFALLPIAIGIALLRHRPYEIDLIINRTLVYGGVTLILAAAFGAANVAAQRLLQAVSGQPSDLVTGALAVGAALLFGPTRRRVRPLVDRFLPARAELALLFTDIVGSTRIAAEVGDERWRNLLDRSGRRFGASSPASGAARSTPPGIASLQRSTDLSPR